MTIYLGNQLIAASPERSTVGRNIGEIVPSTLPLNDASLHLLDGAILDGNGRYGVFTKYIKNLYGESTKYVNASSIGTVTETEGVVSGFSSTDYLYVPHISNTWTTSFDFVLSLTTGSSVNTSQCLFALGLFSEYALALYLNAGVLTLYAGSNGSSYDITGGISSQYVLSPNTGYVIETKFDGTKYTVKLSTDGITYTDVITLNSSTVPYKATNLFIGAQATNYDGTAAASPFLGSINMNYCSLLLDGNTYWTGVTPAWAIDEGGWQHQVETYGSCGKFVYDSTNNTVRLPKIVGVVEGITDVTALGDLVEAGLPNIIGKLTIQNYRNNTEVVQGGTGALYQIGNNGIKQTWGTDYVTNVTNVEGYDTGLDASRSSSIYGKSSTVQPQSIKVLYYIVIDTLINTNSIFDIDQVFSDLADKANRNFDNVLPAGTSLAAAWPMPSKTDILELVLQSSGTFYTAPANGWFSMRVTVGSAGYFKFTSLSDRGSFQAGQSFTSNLQWGGIFIPVTKGEKVVVEYNISTVEYSLVFHYAIGSEAEF